MLYDPKWEAKASPDSKTRAALVDARKLIEQPSAWCRNYENGSAICAVHAIQRAAGYRTPAFDPVVENAAVAALGLAMGIEFPGLGIPEGRWNDTHTHAEVLAAFDRAIAAA